MARAEALEQEIFACQETVADETAVAGPVVITATEALATYFVLRHLPALRSAYPALRVELRRTERTLNRRILRCGWRGRINSIGARDGSRGLTLAFTRLRLGSRSSVHHESRATSRIAT